MNIFDKFKRIFCENISAGEINASSINGMCISGDIISVNNKYGHYEIQDHAGQTAILKLDKYILTFMGGILIDIKEEGENNG